MKRDELISDYMVEQNKMLHQSPNGYGGSGWKSADAVYDFARELRAQSILDYGCGECTLKSALLEKYPWLDIRQYDPAVFGLHNAPHPADLVVCTDVLEHVEPELLDNVLNHLSWLSQKGLYLHVATRLANKNLPDGRNTHLIIESPEWWTDKLWGLKMTLLGEPNVYYIKGTNDCHSVVYKFMRD